MKAMNATALLLLSLAQDGTKPAQPRVSTLELDLELVTYGRLGGLAVDEEGTLFVSNFGPNVWSITPEGKVTEIAGDFVQASGNTIGPDGTLLQADFQRKAIYAIDPVSKESSPIVTDGLESPVGLVADEDWNLYVCDCNANAVLRVSPEGTVTTLASGALFACPNGITRDAEGNLFVVNFANDLLVKIDPQGQATSLLSVGTGGGNAHLALAGRELFVTKIKTNELFAVDLDEGAKPSARLVAGSGKAEIVDGDGIEASLKRPNGLAVDPTGKILYMNNIVGTWRDKTATKLSIRRIELP